MCVWGGGELFACFVFLFFRCFLFVFCCLFVVVAVACFISFRFKSIKTKRLRPQWIFSFAYFLHAGDDCGR